MYAPLEISAYRFQRVIKKKKKLEFYIFYVIIIPIYIFNVIESLNVSLRCANLSLFGLPEQICMYINALWKELLSINIGCNGIKDETEILCHIIWNIVDDPFLVEGK